uniref:TSA: Wollemia nobilis Ref_Wollemi_Transcript_2525_1344 transcribed RNA sequence n=1 Tax=Wollemia nobilis TaxID=56998 RepID=A0A0C9QWV8_9CONI
MAAASLGVQFSRLPSSSSYQAGRNSVKVHSLFNPSHKSAFLNGGRGVGASELLPMQFIVRIRNQCGGGGLGIQMNLFQRIGRVIKSYANAVISAAEDPEKILDQTVQEMNDDLIKMRQASAQVLASQKQLENKYKSAKQAADDWYRRAKLALEKGDENLSREALKRRKDYETNAASLRSQLDQQKGVVEKLITNTQMLERKIQEAKSKKDTLKARAQSAKTSQKVNEMLGNINTSSALSAFEKMEEKVLTMESEAESLNELNTGELEQKFALLEGSSVDEDLASLRKDLLSTSKKGELPPGRTSVSNTSAAYPFQDNEIEDELAELRKKTQL